MADGLGHYSVSVSAGSRHECGHRPKRFAVVERHTSQRLAFYATEKAARAYVKRLNEKGIVFAPCRPEAEREAS